MDPNNPHYAAIREFYGDRVAERSRVPLIQHIDEGLFILETIGAPLRAMEGYCLHPLLQEDGDLVRSMRPGSVLWRHSPAAEAVALAMEYRWVANAYLSQHAQRPGDVIGLSPLPEVNQMLVADKMQNRKDFERYHLGTHPKSDLLRMYFASWLRRLEISEARYDELLGLIADRFKG